MDPGQRRRQTARATRLALLAAALLVSLGFLIGHLEGRGAVGADGPASVQGGAALPEPGTAPSAALFVPPPPAPVEAAPATAPALAPTAPPDAELSRRLEAIVLGAVEDARRRSKGKVTGSNSVVAVRVLDPAGDRELVGRLVDRSLRPASNMKLVTSAAALVELGPGGEFETRLDSSADLVEGVLRGDLVVHAGGDPLYDPGAEGEVAHLLAPLVEELRRAGVREVAGDLVLDEGSFQAPGPAPGWPPSNQYWQEHCALAAGLTANGSCLTAYVRAGKPGADAFSEVRPRPSGLQRVGKVTTASARSRLDIAVGATASRATLRGTIPSSVTTWTSRFAHPDPVGLFGEALSAALAEGGVRLRGGVRRERGRPRGRLLALLRTPIRDVLGPINADSNNAVADQLFLMLGERVSGEGTRRGGRQATEAALRRLGVSTDGLEQVDGSGLSRDDRVTARQLTALLDGVLELDAGVRDAFLGSLAVAGERGSLEQRMRGTAAAGRVHAKTGWIRGTSALSGYVDTTGGRRLVFSILVDYPDVGGLNTTVWKPMQDAICVELAGWSGGGTVR
jgi:D-alanyl-D-alanine carboxypeptidase/D-alanyl-D-alanine-endopeptidase (penicillin-binding protein 4)